MVDSACNKADGRNYEFCRFGKFVGYTKIAYLNCKENKFNSKEDVINSMLAEFEKSNMIQSITLSNVTKDDVLHDSEFSGDEPDDEGVNYSFNYRRPARQHYQLFCLQNVFDQRD